MLLPKLENNTWLTLAIESVLIVLSVVLGFLVTEWHEPTENAALAQTAKQGILNEIATNYQRVTDAHRYHRALQDTLSALKDPAPSTLRDRYGTSVWEIRRHVSGGRFVYGVGDGPVDRRRPSHEVGGRKYHCKCVCATAHLRAVPERNGPGVRAILCPRRRSGQTRRDERIFSRERVLPLVVQIEDQERELLYEYRQKPKHFHRLIPSDTTAPDSLATEKGL